MLMFYDLFCNYRIFTNYGWFFHLLFHFFLFACLFYNNCSFVNDYWFLNCNCFCFVFVITEFHNNCHLRLFLGQRKWKTGEQRGGKFEVNALEFSRSFFDTIDLRGQYNAKIENHLKLEFVWKFIRNSFPPDHPQYYRSFVVGVFLPKTF